MEVDFLIGIESLYHTLTDFIQNHPVYTTYYNGIVRFILPIIAIVVLLNAIRSLLHMPHIPEVWAHLSLPNGVMLDLTHWENTIGRDKKSDIILNYPTLSRQHAALIRHDDGTWIIHEMNSQEGTFVNQKRVKGSAPVRYGDTINLGGIPIMLLPLSDEEQEVRKQARKKEKPHTPWGSLILLTFFQILVMLQIMITMGSETTIMVPLVFGGLVCITWGYFVFLRIARCHGFEMELIAFMLSTVGLGIMGSSVPSGLFKQFLAMILGIVCFLILGIFLRDLKRVNKIRWLMAGASVFLLLISIVFGHTIGGATNWITIAGMSLQPSEIAKICYIFAGAATLERLFRKRNIWGFIALTGVCGGCLAIMSDFGTAAIFFITFLVIAYMRSGDVATLGLICGACVLGVSVLASLKPYILRRFAAWGHVWEDMYDLGYQQTRAMTAAASGGLSGVGVGNGWLKDIPMGNSDLVFGMVCEEWGLLIALLCVASIITLCLFSVRACKMGRSSFYTIAACATSALLVFQTTLNVLGAVDILPLTGVTFPFISAGGTSMIATWGMLAFLKATDTRENSSFAIMRFKTSRNVRKNSVVENTYNTDGHERQKKSRDFEIVEEPTIKTTVSSNVGFESFNGRPKE